MSIIFLFSGKQWEYIPKKKEVFRVDYKKQYKPGDIFLLDRVLSNDEEFGHPFLSLKLKAEITKHGLRKKIIVFKYKAKKRMKVKKGHRSQYTEFKIIGVDKTETTETLSEK